MNYQHREQGKKRVRRLLSIYRARVAARFPQDNLAYYDHDGEFAKRLLKTPVVCSRVCCGNRRRYEGPTRQERIMAGPEEQP